jgi:hypothetical protein
MIHYAALDSYGNVLGVRATAEEATEVALELAPRTMVQVQNIESEPRKNAGIPAREMPALAWDSSGIGQIRESAMTMRLEEAHKRLLPFFDGLIKRGVETQLYGDKLHMADAWIGQNYKTQKEHPERPAQVMGLTLVPAQHARLAALAKGSYAHLWEGEPERAPELAVEKRRMLARWKEETPPLSPKFTLCQGSSADCRESCLVFAGQNASERYNTYRKVAQTLALLSEPEAFMRMVVESIERWLTSRTIRGGTTPFMRMNVLSDVPWELVAPWLFRHFSELQFYDYTKVPGRVTPRNYDLTFSISGERDNLEWALDEISQRDRRVAVVFVGHKLKGGSWVPVKVKGPRAIAEIPLPSSFMGLPVVDGDVSDVRPYDRPSLCCVGLRWKTPSGKRAGGTIDLRTSSFVTPVYIISEEQASRYASQVGQGEHISRWRGGDKPNPSQEQWLIAAVTPRFQPITQPMSQPE